MWSASASVASVVSSPSNLSALLILVVKTVIVILFTLCSPSDVEDKLFAVGERVTLEIEKLQRKSVCVCLCY